MRWLPAALLLLTACNGPCARYCNGVGRLAQSNFPLRLDGEEKARLFYFDGAAFDLDAWTEVCAQAPEGRDCESCSDWVYETFLADVAVADTCHSHYALGDEDAEKRCVVTCRQADLIP